MWYLWICSQSHCYWEASHHWLYHLQCQWNSVENTAVCTNGFFLFALPNERQWLHHNEGSLKYLRTQSWALWIELEFCCKAPVKRLRACAGRGGAGGRGPHVSLQYFPHRLLGLWRTFGRQLALRSVYYFVFPRTPLIAPEGHRAPAGLPARLAYRLTWALQRWCCDLGITDKTSVHYSKSPRVG